MKKTPNSEFGLIDKSFSQCRHLWFSNIFWYKDQIFQYIKHAASDSTAVVSCLVNINIQAP